MNPETPAPKSHPRRSVLRRLGCLVAIVVWGFLLCALPFGFVTLLVEKEIVIPLSDKPEHEIRLFLLDEPDQRGVGLSRPNLESQTEGAYCVKTSLHYLIWEGEGENLNYCDCYEKFGDSWGLTFIGDANCQPPAFEFTTPPPP